MLLSRMARESYHEGDAGEAARLERASAGVMQQAQRLKGLVEKAPDDVVSDAPRLRTDS